MAEQEVVYLKSPGGKTFMDMQAGRAAIWLKRGWTKVSKTEFNAGVKAMRAFENEVETTRMAESQE